jgi:hypothetical protein
MENQPLESSLEVSENEKSVSTFIHLSTFLKYFFPLGNFIGPVILWQVNKGKDFIDANGRAALNFQLSIFVYTLIICFLCLPFFAIFVTDFVSLVESIEHHSNHIRVSEIENIAGYIMLASVVALLFFGLFLLELYAVINAAMHASKGTLYRYPLCINFFKSATLN